MILFEARNSKEMLFSLLFSFEFEGEVVILNLSGQNFSGIGLDVRIVNVPYKTLKDKVFYHLLGVTNYKDIRKSYVFHDFSPLVRKAKAGDVELIEHGFINYMDKSFILNSMTKISRFLTMFLARGICGRNLKIKRIHVSNPLALPLDIKHKGVGLDLMKRWQALSVRDVSAINAAFSYKSISEPGHILVTQPIEIFEGISEQDKISLYYDLMKCCDLDDFSIYIKKHPLEKTNYEQLFNNVNSISDSYPLELVFLNDSEKIYSMVTLFSSAVLPFSAEVPIFWGGAFGRSELEKIYRTDSFPMKLLNSITVVNPR